MSSMRSIVAIAVAGFVSAPLAWAPLVVAPFVLAPLASAAPADDANVEAPQTSLKRIYTPNQKMIETRDPNAAIPGAEMRGLQPTAPKAGSPAAERNANHA